MVSIGFIAYHKSVPIIDFRYLAPRQKSVWTGLIPGIRNSITPTSSGTTSRH